MQTWSFLFGFGFRLMREEADTAEGGINATGQDPMLARRYAEQ